MKAYDAELLARQLMRQHGLRLWFFEFADWVTTFGQCSHHISTLYLSRPLTLLNTEEEVKDTILHEIAHALVGSGHGHDKIWKAKCVEIGARPKRCYSLKTVTQPPMRYVATCEACKKVWSRTRKISRGRRTSCTCQKGKHWDKRVLLKYVDTKKQIS